MGDSVVILVALVQSVALGVHLRHDMHQGSRIRNAGDCVQRA